MEHPSMTTPELRTDAHGGLIVKLADLQPLLDAAAALGGAIRNENVGMGSGSTLAERSTDKARAHFNRVLMAFPRLHCVFMDYADALADLETLKAALPARPAPGGGVEDAPYQPTQDGETWQPGETVHDHRIRVTTERLALQMAAGQCRAQATVFRQAGAHAKAHGADLCAEVLHHAATLIVGPPSLAPEADTRAILCYRNRQEEKR